MCYFIYYSSIVLAAMQDEASAAASTECFEALEMIGGKEPFQREYRGSFAIIGYKGTKKVTWIEQKKFTAGKGPAELTKTIKTFIDEIL